MTAITVTVSLGAFIRAGLAQIRGEIQSLRVELQNVREEIQSVRGEIRSVRGEIQNVREEIQNVREEYREDIQGVRREFREEIQGLRAEVHGLATEHREDHARLLVKLVDTADRTSRIEAVLIQQSNPRLQVAAQAPRPKP